MDSASDFINDILEKVNFIDTDDSLCTDLKIGFIGFGLIGGSIARALKKLDSN